MKRTIIASIIGALISCTSTDQFTPQEMEGIILEHHKLFESSIPIKNLPLIMSNYDDEAIHMPIQNKILKGKREIAEAWKKTFSYNVIAFDMEIVDVSGSNDWIYEVGITSSTFDFEGKELNKQFKYLNIWKRQMDDSFKIYRGIYNELITN